jgi:hypothetical protein
MALIPGLLLVRAKTLERLNGIKRMKGVGTPRTQSSTKYIETDSLKDYMEFRFDSLYSMIHFSTSKVKK